MHSPLRMTASMTATMKASVYDPVRVAAWMALMLLMLSNLAGLASAQGRSNQGWVAVDYFAVSLREPRYPPGLCV